MPYPIGASTAAKESPWKSLPLFSLYRMAVVSPLNRRGRGAVYIAGPA